MVRSATLQQFLDEVAAALRAITQGAAGQAAGRIAERLGAAGLAAEVSPERLPVCDGIAPALLAAQGSAREGLARAFGQLQGQLAWRRRPSAVSADERFWNGHANAEILGPNGFERRNDLWMGASLMAPGLDYPRHGHPPEEIYLALSPGQWWNERMDWTDPGLDGFIYNPPGIAHAMRSGSTPLLALWVLPL